MRNNRHWGRADGRRRAGFTLVEIMLVVVIIGILLATVIPTLSGKAEKARIVATKQQMEAIKSSLQMYEMNVGSFPTTEQGLMALVECPSDVEEEMWGDRPYLESVPKDGWKRNFVYVCPPEHHHDYDLSSQGKSVEDEADDIVNWRRDDEEENL